MREHLPERPPVDAVFLAGRPLRQFAGQHPAPDLGPHLHRCIHSSCLALGRGKSRLRRDCPLRDHCTVVRCIFRPTGLPRRALHFSTGVHRGQIDRHFLTPHPRRSFAGRETCEGGPVSNPGWGRHPGRPTGPGSTNHSWVDLVCHPRWRGCPHRGDRRRMFPLRRRDRRRPTPPSSTGIPPLEHHGELFLSTQAMAWCLISTRTTTACSSAKRPAR